jgi:hypothetical protein
MAYSDETAKIIETVINADALAPYYHVDTLHDRKPLRIQINNVLKEKYPLSMFGESVVYVTDSPHLVFSRLDISGEKAEVAFRYLPEGVRGEMSLEKKNIGWMVTRSNLVEE